MEILEVIVSTICAISILSILPVSALLIMNFD